MKRKLSILAAFLLLAVAVMAQWGFGRGRGGRGGRSWIPDDIQTAREVPQRGAETPTWTNATGFEKDVFAFARIRYDASGRRGAGWNTDLPDSDLNLSYRLQQMTALKVDPDGRIIHLAEKELANYPFIYIVEPGGLFISEDEAAALRKYLLNGGFLWLDDFWGDREWENMAFEMSKVFPDRDFVEMPIEHPLYHCVFNIKAKNQVPDVGTGTRSQITGITWEYHEGDCRTVHHRGIFDDKGRLMVFATHNTDNGDGWEWEGDNLYYFREFSEKTAYPLAVNVVFYVMTH